MGSLQATSLLIRDKCDILIHINVNVEKTVPAYDRIRAFEETCKEYQVPYDIDLSVSGNFLSRDFKCDKTYLYKN